MQGKVIEYRAGKKALANGARNMYVKLKNKKVYKFNSPLSEAGQLHFIARMKEDNTVRLKNWTRVDLAS